MTIKCEECGHDYDPETVEIVAPLPDKTCFVCMSVLTDEEIQAHMQKLGIVVPKLEPNSFIE